MSRYSENIQRTISIDPILGLVQNTFVGNASSFLASASDIEIRFGISSGSVSDFLVVGTDVYFKINLSQYDFNNVPFNALSEPATAGVTFFIDKDGLLRNSGSSAFRYQNSLSFFMAKNATQLGSQALRRTIKNYVGGKYISLRDVTTIGSECFSRHYFKRLNIWSAVSLGSNCMQSISSTAVMVYANESLATSNGGGVDAELVQLNGLGKVTFVPDAQKNANVDSVTDLAAINITSSTFDLTFTTPASDNPISFYQVWMDDGTQDPKQLFWYNDEIYTSGGTVTGIPSGTRKVKIVACDIYWNESPFSNEILVTI